MTQVSRPMQIVLLVTVLFAAVWFVALRPKDPSAGGGSAAAPAAPTAPGVKGLTTAIAKAHGAVATANAAGERAAGTPAAPATPQQRSTAPAPAAATHAPARHATVTHVRSHHAAASRTRSRHVAAPHARRPAPSGPAGVRRVDAALRAHKAIAIAFVVAAAADSRALAAQVRQVSSFHGRALVLAVPIGELSAYDAITREVQITTAPTTVIVAPNGAATTIVGYADRFEIQQRLADALATKR